MSALDPGEVEWIARKALPCLRILLEKVDAVPFDIRGHDAWMLVRKKAGEAVKIHEELIKLAHWIGEKPAENRAIFGHF